jgi:hypothetical protein
MLVHVSPTVLADCALSSAALCPVASLGPGRVGVNAQQLHTSPLGQYFTQGGTHR